MHQTDSRFLFHVKHCRCFRHFEAQGATTGARPVGDGACIGGRRVSPGAAASHASHRRAIAGSKQRQIYGDINPQKPDRQRGNKQSNKSNANPTSSTPAPARNHHASSERSSSAAGLNTARTSTPLLVVSSGHEEETAPMAHAGVTNADEGAASSSSVLVLPSPTPSIPVVRLRSKI